MNNDLSFAANVRRWNTGYAAGHRTANIAIREKLGLLKPRNSGFDRGNRDFSAYREFIVGGDEEGLGEYSASKPVLFWVKWEDSIWMRGVVGFSVGRGLELLLFMRTRFMLRVQGRGSRGLGDCP